MMYLSDCVRQQFHQSMKKDGLKLVPIIVNSNFVVVDGQHRVTAAKEAGKGIYYIVDNTSSRGSNNNGGYYGQLYRNSVSWAVVQFMNYSNTTTNKTWLSRWASMGGSDGANLGGAIVGLWRNTNAITQIDFNRPAGESGSFDVGCTWTLYGIKAA